MVGSRTLCQAALVMFCALAAQVAVAQDSPTNGKALFENTATASGQAGLQSCTTCHLTVQNRRDAIDPGGDVDFDLVLARFTTAMTAQSVMNPFIAGLTTQQKRDIAAYIADVPKARPNLVDFTASAVNTETAATAITFRNAVTATTPLTITSIGLTGSSADFLIKTAGTTCSNSLVLAAGASCVVNVSFRTASATTKVALLNVAYTQGGIGATNRTAQLSGTVAGQPGGGGSSSSSGGGGALPLAALGFVAFAALLRRRR